MSTKSTDETRGEVPLSLVVEASDSGLSYAQDLRRLHFTFRSYIPTPATTLTRARTLDNNKSETASPILESIPDTPRSSGAGTAGGSSYIFDAQYWSNVFTPPSSRSQSVEPSPERRSCSRGVISKPLTGKSSRRAASSGRQESPTSHSAEDSDRQSLQTISTDPGSQNSRSEHAPDTKRSNNDRTSIDHPNSPEIQTIENSRRHFEEVKDSALSQKASAKENRGKVSDKSKEELEESHPSSLEETTPEDATLSAKYGVNDENAQDDRPSSLISHNEEPGSRPVEKSILDVFNGLFVGFDALARFNKRENYCIANTKKGERCTRLMRQIDVSKIRRLLTHLSAPYETERFNSELLPLVNLLICERSHREDVRKLIENSQHGASVDNETTVAATAACTVEEPKHERYDLRSSPTFQANPPSFTPWQPAHSQNLDVSAAVAKTMREPLIGTEEKPGWLYVYWNPSNSGYYKIGYTGVGIAERLRKWETQCGHRAEQITLSLPQEGFPETKEVEKVPHARRLEALVHTTLKKDRCCEPRCPTCYKCHKEWFRVNDLYRIKRVIAFWSEWIRRGPYEFVEGDGKWMLKAEFKEEVEAIGQRLEELENRTYQSQAAIRPGPRTNERRGEERRNPSRRNIQLPDTRELRRLQ